MVSAPLRPCVTFLKYHYTYTVKLATLSLILILTLFSVTAQAQQHKWKPSGKIMPKKPMKARMYKGHLIEPKVNPYHQDTLLHPIPVSRSVFHDKIDKEQIAIDKADGIPDTVVSFKRDTAWSSPLSLAFLDEVDAMQVLIENMPPNGRDE